MVLVDLLQSGQIDRQMVASVIRTSGVEGEHVLTKFLTHHKNEKVRIAVASVLGYRPPKIPTEIDIRIDEEQVTTMAEIPLGCICTYVGPVTALAAEEPDEDEFDEEPYLLINR